LTSLPRILRYREIRTSLYSTRRKGHPGRFARVKSTRGYPALLANPERETNSPAAKTSPLGLDTVERKPPEAAPVLSLLDGDSTATATTADAERFANYTVELNGLTFKLGVPCILSFR
jgi:hypothetical protein